MKCKNKYWTCRTSDPFFVLDTLLMQLTSDWLQLLHCEFHSNFHGPDHSLPPGGLTVGAEGHMAGIYSAADGYPFPLETLERDSQAQITAG